LQIIAINLDINALACFDNMVKPCTSLSCLSHGADPWYIWLQAQTQKLFKYFVKHQFGISSDYNFYSDKHPWYGAAQGSTDSAIQLSDG